MAGLLEAGPLLVAPSLCALGKWLQLTGPQVSLYEIGILNPLTVPVPVAHDGRLVDVC